VTVNLLLAYGAPDVSWLWWNLAGCLVAVLIGHLGGRRSGAPRPEERRDEAIAVARHDKSARRLSWLLVAEFAAILSLLVVLTVLFR
jgi:hypothetical protein